MNTVDTTLRSYLVRSAYLAWSGILAPMVLGLTLVAFAVLQPDYNHLNQAISELGMQGAPFATLWNSIGFVLVGALVIVFAWGLHLELRPDRSALFIAVFVALSGLGWLGLGLFPAAPAFAPSTQTTLHFVMVALNVLSFLVAAVVFGVRWRAYPFWKRYALLSLLIGLVALGSFFIPQTVPPGLSQRIGIGANFVWLLMMGIALRRKPGSG